MGFMMQLQNVPFTVKLMNIKQLWIATAQSVEHSTLFLNHSTITLPMNMKISKNLNKSRKIGFENK